MHDLRKNTLARPTGGVLPEATSDVHAMQAPCNAILKQICQTEAMLPVLITIDTEYSSGLFRSGGARGRADNFARTIACRSSSGESGIFYQMDIFEKHGVRAVFFVDPMPALVWGQSAVDAVVQPILERGHEVQLHCHTEWLDFAQESPVGDRRGHHIRNFSQPDQVALLEWCLQRIEAAGAPRPIAFRAGNYSANDDTLRALAQLGLSWDSSFPAGYDGSLCEISLPPGDCRPVRHCEMQEFPASAIAARNRWRHAQLTALSFAEIRGAVEHAAASDWPGFCLVSHSFELYNRQSERPNRLLCRRFEKLCDWLGRSTIAQSAGFADLADDIAAGPSDSRLPLLPHSTLRTGARMAEQFASNMLFR